MKVAIIQHTIREHQLEWNLLQLEQLMDSQPGADLYVLSETFATGFMAEGSAARAHEESPLILDWMRRQARRLNAALSGSMAAVGDEVGVGGNTVSQPLLRNRLYFVRPDGSSDYYDKRHLFSIGGENADYAAGSRRVVVEWRGLRFLLQVCYDLRFPVFSRNRGDYDAAIYVANWPQSRCDVWQTLLKARAIENQCYVVGVNIVGCDAEGRPYQGDSVVLDAYGRCVASCVPGRVGAAVAGLSRETLSRFRRKFPVLTDADAFELEE